MSMLSRCAVGLTFMMLLVFCWHGGAEAAPAWEETGGPEGGMVQALAITPADSQIIYAGVNGGIYKSTNGGTSWYTANNGLINRDVRALVISPANSQTIYAGVTGGIYKSIDNGTTWTAVNNGLTAKDVRSLAINPANSQLIYAATYSGGVYKTSNGGSSWAAVNNGLANTAIYVIAVAQENPQTIYAGTAAGVFRSTNGGDSWQEVDTGLSNKEVLSLVIDPGNSQILYVGTNGGGVFKSIDGGSSWTASNDGLAARGIAALAIDPGNSQTLHAGSNGVGISKSTDGGASWTMVNDGLAAKYIRALAIDPAASQVIYAGTMDGGVFRTSNGGSSWNDVNSGLSGYDVRSIAIDHTSNRILYAGVVGGGVFNSNDGGATWAGINNNSPSRYISSLAIDPVHSQTIYAGSNGGGVLKSTDGGSSWTSINSGLGSLNIRDVTIGSANGNIIFAGSWAAGIFKTSDAGASWQEVNNGLTNLNIRALAIDPSDSQTIYAGTLGGKIFKSINGGGSWSALTNSQPDKDVLSIVIDPASRQTVYCATWGGGIYKSNDAGASWSQVNTGLTSLYAHAMLIDPIDKRTIYAGTWGGVFISTDGGSNWTAVNTGLTNDKIRTLAIDPVEGQRIYAGTWGGPIFAATLRPIGSISINNGNAFTGSRDVTLTLTTSTGSSFRLSSNGISWGDWAPFAATKKVTLPPGDGTKIVFVQFKDDSGNISKTYSDDIVLDTTKPLDGKLIATQLPNDGIQLSWSNFKDTGSEISGFRLVRGTTLPASCTRVGAGQTLINLAADLSSYIDNGTSENPLQDNTLYYYRLCAIDTAGNMSSGATASARSISELDPPAGTVTLNGGVSFTNKLPVTVTVDATDATGVAAYCISNGSSCAAWIPVKPAAKTLHLVKTWALLAGSDGPRTVNVRLRDSYGNETATPLSASITLDSKKPTDGILTATVPDGTDNTLSLSWTAATDTNGSGIREYRLYYGTPGYPACKGTPLATVAADKPLAFTHENLSAAKKHSYRLCAVDNGGNVSTGATGTAKSTDSTPPAAPWIKINNDAQYANATKVTLSLGATDAGGLASVCLRNENVPAEKCVWKAYSATIPWTLTSGDGTKTVYAKFKDTNGNLSDETSDTITLDMTAPAQLSLVVNGSAAYTTSMDVTLTLGATDPLSGVSAMQVSESSTFVGATWEPYETTHDYKLASAKNGTRVVYARFRDSAGNVSAAVKDTIVLDTLSPVLSVTTAFVEPTTLTEKTIRGTKEAYSSIEITANTSVTIGAITSTPAGTTWSCTVSGFAEGENIFTVKATDPAGNITTSEVSITYAPFKQADLEGTWNIVGAGYTTYSGQVTRGTIEVDGSGVISAGILWVNGESATISGGRLTIDGSGSITGSIGRANSTALTVESANMSYSRGKVTIVVSSGTEHQLLSAFKSGSERAISDYAGDWYIYGVYAATVYLNGGLGRAVSGLLYGSLTVDSSGTISRGTIRDMFGHSGDISGGPISNETADERIGMALTDDVFYLYSSAEKANTYKEYETFVGIKGGGVHSLSALEGTWDLKTVKAGYDIYYGSITFDKVGKITGGSVKECRFELDYAVTGGRYAVSASGNITGSSSYDNSYVKPTFKVVSGRMAASQEEFVVISRSQYDEVELTYGSKRK